MRLVPGISGGCYVCVVNGRAGDSVGLDPMSSGRKGFDKMLARQCDKWRPHSLLSEEVIISRKMMKSTNYYQGRDLTWVYFDSRFIICSYRSERCTWDEWEIRQCSAQCRVKGKGCDKYKPAKTIVDIRYYYVFSQEEVITRRTTTEGNTTGLWWLHFDIRPAVCLYRPWRCISTGANLLEFNKRVENNILKYITRNPTHK